MRLPTTLIKFIKPNTRSIYLFNQRYFHKRNFGAATAREQKYCGDSLSDPNIIYTEWAEDYDKTMAEWNQKSHIAIADLVVKHCVERRMNFYKRFNKDPTEWQPVILDVGCGTGLVGNALSDRQVPLKNLIGVDVSDKMLKAANTKGLYKDVGHCDLAKGISESIGKNTVDIITCSDVLSEVKDHLDIVFQSMIRVVKHNGYIIFSHRSDLVDENFRKLIAKYDESMIGKYESEVQLSHDINDWPHKVKKEMILFVFRVNKSRTWV